MDPSTVALLVNTAGNAVAAGSSGGEQGTGKTSVVNPYQRNLQQMMQYQAMQGNYGDMGFGRAAKHGTGQLQQMMADRGISPQSGVATAGMGQVMADAASTDTANLRNYMMGLAQLAPATVNSEGWDWDLGPVAPNVGVSAAGFGDPRGTTKWA